MKTVVKNMDNIRAIPETLFMPDQFIQIHEDLIKSILRNLLDREPVPTDAKRLTRGVRMDTHDYSLAWDGVHIGDVRFNVPGWLPNERKRATRLLRRVAPLIPWCRFY